jgi:hypothetical protein
MSLSEGTARAGGTEPVTRSQLETQTDMGMTVPPMLTEFQVFRHGI